VRTTSGCRERRAPPHSAFVPVSGSSAIASRLPTVCGRRGQLPVPDNHESTAMPAVAARNNRIPYSGVERAPATWPTRPSGIEQVRCWRTLARGGRIDGQRWTKSAEADTRRPPLRPESGTSTPTWRHGGTMFPYSPRPSLCRDLRLPHPPTPHVHQVSNTIRYDTRCYFDVRSKADTSQLNLPHGNRHLKSV